MRPSFRPKAARRCHPLAYHSPGVAAVGRVSMGHNPELAFLSNLLALAHAAAIDLLTFLPALHDLGKFSRPRQAKAPAFYPTVLGAPPELVDIGHGRASASAFI